MNPLFRNYLVCLAAVLTAFAIVYAIGYLVR
jgi:hypothetical protein